MELDKQIESALNTIFDMKAVLKRDSGDIAQYQFRELEALIELEKVRSNILIAQALNRIATCVRYNS